MESATVHDRAWRHLLEGMAAAVGLSIVVAVTAQTDRSPLGAPQVWPWILTGLQVLALWAAGRSRWWAWLLGGAVQLPWIVYALATDQIGFIPGCAISASVQIASFLRSPSIDRPMEVAT